ncbi:DivIVA domain-containing protein [Pseudarthrobacter sp. J1738]|uniref:DivIVA domain-containing protein n=1 Tax=unclassified Pseudarthrobacter TaxID=2647000 RepID=UPI003D286C63
MSNLLVFLAVVVIGVAAIFGTPLLSRLTVRGRKLGTPAWEDGLDDPVPNLPAVLLPSDPRAEDVDRVRFALGLRGYRMDQVDEVLDALRDELTIKDAYIKKLEHQLAHGAPEADSP